MSEQKSVVGPHTHIIGNLKGDGDLCVVGRVDGTIALGNALTVEPSGIVVANVEANSALISGTVVGNVTASDLIHVQPEGRVVGDLCAVRVVLAEGASFRGNVEMPGLSLPDVNTRSVASASKSNGQGRSISRAASASRVTPRATSASTKRAPKPRTAAGRKVAARRRAS